MATRAVSLAPRWSWPCPEPFGNLRVRYGIKVGLAGVLALWSTQLLRLPNDNWAILTVIMLMSAQFVGSVAFKGLMRVTGTVAGALLGIWLVSDYTSTPEVFLPVLFLVMALASYQFGQVGARQVPYAHFFARPHRPGRRHRWGHRPGPSLADRPGPNRGDRGRHPQLATGQHPAVAPLRARRVL
jgi:hypothetical protein